MINPFCPILCGTFFIDSGVLEWMGIYNLWSLGKKTADFFTYRDQGELLLVFDMHKTEYMFADGSDDAFNHFLRIPVLSISVYTIQSLKRFGLISKSLCFL